MAVQEKELTSVQLDHCYAKPWDGRLLNSLHRPARYLYSSHSNPSHKQPEEPVDVGNFDIVEETKERAVTELEKKVLALKPDDLDDAFEENMKRDGWTTLQQRLMSKVLKVLNQHRLGCLSVESRQQESIQKKLQFEASSKKLRAVLSSISWETKLTQWLHLTLIENLSRESLINYIEILQTLRTKVPSLVDRMLSVTTPDSKLASMAMQVKYLAFEKPEEGTNVTLSNANLKLSSSPFFIMVPSGSNSPNSSFRMLNGSKKFQKWQNLFQNLGKVVSVSLHTVTAPQLLPMPVFLDSVINATVQRVQELKTNCFGRPIVLVGLQHGALMAAQVASLESVDALVLLGLPTTSIEGKRGEPDDPILDLKVPAVFVIGENSTTTSVDAIEHMRHSMKAETAMVVVGGATDSLKMLQKKKRMDNVHQTNVDMAVLEEVAAFLGSVLVTQFPSADRAPARLDRRIESGSIIKRVRLTVDKEEAVLQTALSGHNYSQNPGTFTQPRGRGGLTRVRGGRTGTSRGFYGRTFSDSTPVRGKGSRAPSRLLSTPVSSVSEQRRRSLTISGEAFYEPRDLTSGASTFDESSLHEFKGGDSSETESAPPPESEDAEDLMEDLRFREELLEKHERSKKLRTEGKELSDDEELGDRKRRYSGSTRKMKPKREAKNVFQASADEDEAAKSPAEEATDRKTARKRKRRMRYYAKRAR